MIRVLVVDDDPLAAEAHAAYVDRVSGFGVAGMAGTASSAYLALGDPARAPIELVLLDVTLPDASGLELARRLRAERSPVDIMAITAVRDLETVQAAVAVGAVSYLIKPFGFPALRARLEQYAAYRQRVGAGRGAATQSEIDSLLSTLRPSAPSPLPKGLSAETLEAVTRALRASASPCSASEVADRMHSSRVTARRYLEHLADVGAVRRAPRYGTPGRPETVYSLVWADGRVWR